VKQIGITGAFGLVGWHLRAYLHGLSDMQPIPGGRDLFVTPGALDSFVRQSDVIVHLAGMNRGEPEEVAQTNTQLTRQLIAALDSTGSQAHIIFSSSTHIDRDTAYGASKRESADLLRAWSERSGGLFTNLILPGVFGEQGKPFYNSVISTFCYQIANGQMPEIQQDGELHQLHAQSVARIIESTIRLPQQTSLRPAGQLVTVTELRDRLSALASQYRENIFPALADPFTRDLFNTYRSYLFPQHYPICLQLHEDSRGTLFEIVKGHSGGQSFLSTTHPGITRGNHYHTRKVERFLVTSGEARIKLRRLFTSEVISFDVSGDAPVAIDIPTLYTHNITNTGSKSLTTMFWTHELFDPNQPDTVAELVESI